jgi:hypothetical protein
MLLIMGIERNFVSLISLYLKKLVSKFFIDHRTLKKFILDFSVIDDNYINNHNDDKNNEILIKNFFDLISFSNLNLKIYDFIFILKFLNLKSILENISKLKIFRYLIKKLK